MIDEDSTIQRSAHQLVDANAAVAAIAKPISPHGAIAATAPMPRRLTNHTRSQPLVAQGDECRPMGLAPLIAEVPQARRSNQASDTERDYERVDVQAGHGQHAADYAKRDWPAVVIASRGPPQQLQIQQHEGDQ